MIPHHAIPTQDANAALATLSAGAATAMFWGLKVSDICMILSTLATFLGLGFQIFLAMRRIHRLEHRQETHIVVTEALSESHRVLDKNLREKE